MNTFFIFIRFGGQFIVSMHLILNQREYIVEYAGRSPEGSTHLLILTLALIFTTILKNFELM